MDGPLPGPAAGPSAARPAISAAVGRPGGARPAGGVQSVDRALDILEALARSSGPVGVGEVAAMTGLPQGTAHRLLRSLRSRGYVRHDAARKYSLGAATLRLGDAAHQTLAHTARPFLTRLVEDTGETANLSILEGDDVVYVAQVSSPHTLRMFAEVGRHVSPHSTASGKVLLAGLSPERAASVVRRLPLPRLTETTITDPAELLAEVDQTRERGWAVDEGEQERGVRCVAVPVGGAADVVAAISLSGPAERFAGAAQNGLVEEMTRVAAAFAAEVAGAD
ncbi:IclR family transcriptional regulator [Nocardioides mesophilus]|uniref:Glycerol operon regulatory protein n=1 Tax=Nocardioides mesophilus TaxID=433659 RepID=A0A7G9RE93_9ACTN|nr:IclR family transcriptional regulator [Nocardioides mesophilus]QNN53918.1 IclR family transcriptional regulator [Nocardioides mesophilus]